MRLATSDLFRAINSDGKLPGGYAILEVMTSGIKNQHLDFVCGNGRDIKIGCCQFGGVVTWLDRQSPDAVRIMDELDRRDRLLDAG